MTHGFSWCMLKTFCVDLGIWQCTLYDIFCQFIIKQIWTEAFAVEHNRVWQAEKNDTLIIKICSEIGKLHYFLVIFKPEKIRERSYRYLKDRRSPSLLPNFHPIENLCRLLFPSGDSIAVPLQLLVTTVKQQLWSAKLSSSVKFQQYFDFERPT